MNDSDDDDIIRLESKFNIIKINWKFHLNFLKRNPQKRGSSAGNQITALKFCVGGILVRRNNENWLGRTTAERPFSWDMFYEDQQL